jgi:predicted membrane protein
MRNQGMALIGGLLMIAGILLLLGNLFDFNLWAVCLPLGLIALGVFVLVRPRMVGPDTHSHVAFVDEAERAGPWALTNEEHWAFVLDATFDLTKADVPPGETLVRAVGFVNDVEIIVPADVGLALDLASFVTSLKLEGGAEEDSFLAPVHWRSDGYKGLERRVRFELTQFVGDIKVRTV